MSLKISNFIWERERDMRIKITSKREGAGGPRLESQDQATTWGCGLIVDIVVILD